MMPAEEGHDLLLSPGEWKVTLHGGGVLHVWAVGYTTEKHKYVFVLFMAGSPNYEAPVLSIPRSRVAKIRGPV
jgi:hypothetical protein